jgi:hypothetical protein
MRRSANLVAHGLVLLGLACSGNDEAAGSSQGTGAATDAGGNDSGTGGTEAGARGGGGGSGGSNTGGTGNFGGSGANDGGVTPIVCGGPLSTAVDEQQNPAVSQKLHLNQIGFPSVGSKRAIVEASGQLTTFQVVSRTDGSVYVADALTPIANFNAWGGGPNWYVADFSDLCKPGTYALLVNGAYSADFEIAPHLYFERTFDAVLGYFRASRADDADVWSADAAVPFYGSTSTHNVQGGWYDATGDISKYLSHLSYANFLNPQQIPLVAWALAWVYDDATSLLTTTQREDLRAEALFGADYLLRVLDDAGYFYIGVFDGWTGSLSARRICAFVGSTGQMTTAYPAAFREGGGMSIAALARIARWNSAGSFPASEYLAGAERAFAYLQANGASHCDDATENVIDDYTALLGACELYAATAESSYLDAARTRVSSLVARQSSTGYFIADGGSRPFWHASDAGLPVVALARYLEVETDSARHEPAANAIRRHLQYWSTVTQAVENPFGYARQHFISQSTLQSGFFIPHDNETGYWWQGENARLASIAAAAVIGSRAIGDAGALGMSDASAVLEADQLDWILGKNPLDVCFLSGFGSNNPPRYCAHKPQNEASTGGIANGITGSDVNGGGIQYNTSSFNCGDDWRWIEQWLPHAAWYTIATAAQALAEPPLASN